jgi:hypothetical protein
MKIPEFYLFDMLHSFTSKCILVIAICVLLVYTQCGPGGSNVPEASANSSATLTASLSADSTSSTPPPEPGSGSSIPTQTPDSSAGLVISKLPLAPTSSSGSAMPTLETSSVSSSSTSSSSISTVGAAPWSAGSPTAWGDAKVLAAKTHEDIAIRIPLREYLASKGMSAAFTSEAQYILFKDGTKAIFKPVDKEDPKEVAEAQAEETAYWAAVEFGFVVVPAAVFHTFINPKNGQEEVGSLQYFIEGAPNMAVAHAQYESALATGRITPLQLVCIKLYGYLLNQWDLCGNNILMHTKEDSQIDLIPIDNANSSHEQYVQYGQHPFVKSVKLQETYAAEDEGRPFPFDKLIMLPENHTQDMIQDAFKGRLPEFYFIYTYKYHAGKPFRGAAYKGHLWYQCDAHEPTTFRLSRKDVIPVEILEKIKRIDLPMLERIFEPARGNLCHSRPHAGYFRPQRRSAAYTWCRCW